MKRIKKLKNFIQINNMLSIVIPLTLAVLLIAPLIFNVTIKDIHQKNTLIATTIANRMADFINESFLVLAQLRDLLNAGVLKDDAAIKVYLNTVIEGVNTIEGFEILDASGIVTLVVPENTNIQGANRSSQNFFSETKARQQPTISPTFISQQTGQPTITIAIPHRDGVLVAYLNLKEISLLSLNLSQTFGDQVTVAVTDERGVYISNKDMAKVYQREIERNFNAVHQEAEAETGSQITTAIYDGQKTLVSHADVSNGDWHVFVYQTYDSIINTFTPLLAVILLLLGLLIAFSRFIGRHIFKDINHSFTELNQQTREIAAGDYHRIDEDNRFDEFNTLTENFNQMVTSIKERDETLKALAYYDPQTQLPNAAYLAEQLNLLILDNHKRIAVICYDIENFKRINDTYGPSFGDRVLEVMGRRIIDMKLIRGFIARITGANFIRVLTAVEHPNDVLSEIEILRQVFNRGITINENNVYVHFHVGIALYPDDAQTVEELLQYAHAASDMAKQRGGSQYAFFESTMKLNLVRNMTLENSLRSALANKEFYLHYQPQIDVKTGAVRGFEALIRWEHPQLGKISPLDFIHLAESTGLIVPIGAWVLETACRQMVDLNQKVGSKMMISVNISPVQINSVSFPEMVENTLKRSGLSPELLELEITENLFIHSLEDAVKIFDRLKAIGIKMSLDDFGTGYSSLAYLKNLPIDTLKIDQAFTRDLLIKKSNESLMESIIMMAHILDMDVIVEGVEELEQFDCLKTYQCDHVQGYYFSRPIAESDLEALLNELAQDQSQNSDNQDK
ncbi:MAG: EAL domain-containing protein [Acetobacterium sp.]|nr:EAL domain-containing protein [Acetobacterium sp.]